MNIFYVDKNPETAAKMMCDKHIIKMILESAQMLCTAKRVLDGIEYTDFTKNGRKIRRWRLENSNEEAIIYKAGWLGHPSTQWVLKSAYNYIWLYKHFLALNEEYKLRWQKDKDHVSITKLAELLKTPPQKKSLKGIVINSPLKNLLKHSPTLPENGKKLFISESYFQQNKR